MNFLSDKQEKILTFDYFLCLDHKKFIDEKNRYISFKSPNIFFKILNCLLSVLKIQPIQLLQRETSMNLYNQSNTFIDNSQPY